MAAAHNFWLSPEQLAEEFGVPLNTIYQWRTKGYGPPGLRVGRHVRYRRQDVDKWAEQQLAQSSRPVA